MVCPSSLLRETCTGRTAPVHQITVGTVKISGNSDHFRRSVCIPKETQYQTFTRMSQTGTCTSQHDVSSVQVLLNLPLFLELDRFLIVFVTKFVDEVVNKLVVFSWTRQFLTLETCQPSDFSGTRWNAGCDWSFHEKIHQEHPEVHSNHRIVDPMLQESDATVLEPTSCTSTQCISRSLRRPFEVGRMEPESGGKNTLCHGRTKSRFCSADLRPADLLKS